MYERYWRLQRPAFRAAAPTDFFFAARSQQAGLLKLKYLVEQRQGIAAVTGLPGSGKSFLLDAFRSQLSVESGPVVEVLFPQMNAVEFLGYLAAKLQDTTNEPERTGDRLDRVLRRLELQLGHWTDQNRQPVIVIDDAQLIEDPHVWQMLQQLLNYRRDGGPEFSIVLCGQPELVGQLRRHAALFERLAFVAAVDPLSADETADYVQHRLQAAGATEDIFHPAALESLHRLSQGLPRRINRLCDFALLVGYAEQLERISPTEVEAVAAELCPVAA
jgi:type II secretory pathway predicted ATPase ExeA